MKKLDSVLINNGISDRLSLIKIHYALEIIKNEAIKIIILCVLFLFLDRLTEYIISLAFLLPMRTFSGGMHMKSNISCFLYSLVFFLLAIIVLPLLTAPTPILISGIIVSALAIAMLSPIASYKRPIKTESRKKSLKKWTQIFLSIDMVVLIIFWRFNLYEYFVIGTLVIILQALQLFITWANRKRKEGKIC
jgi:Membrane protein putatively involved in post-translational modification of the autoinducing quorum-sensing peptide